MLVGLLRPEDHLKGSHLPKPPTSDRQAVGVGGDQDASVLEGPDQEGLVDRVFTDDVDRLDDVPAFVSETLDEGSGDARVRRRRARDVTRRLLFLESYLLS